VTQQTASALPPVVDQQTWQAALDDLRVREKAATRELDAIAAQRRRLPMVELPDYTLIGPDGPLRLVDVFDGRSQLIVYNHMWSDGAEWQCGGCTGLTSQYVRLGFLDNYDARFVIVTNGPIDEALAYKAKVGNEMDWYSSSESSFGADVGAPPGGLRGERVPPRRRQGVPHLAHGRPRYRTAQLHLRVGRHPAVGPPGGVAGFTRRLAEVAHLLQVARLSRRRPALRPGVGVMGAEPSRRGHLPINGLSLYHEVYGELGGSETSPLLLIPGAFMGTDSMRSWVSAFAGERAVIVFDQQGHGRTPDTSRAMSYEQFGDDAAALLRALQVERADVMGYSQGGGVALQLALRHPTLIGKLVSLSATYRRDGWYPSVLEGIKGVSAAAFAGTPVEKAFMDHTPDAAAFDAYLEKMKVLNVEDQNISDAQMRSISAKTMVIVGDADGVTPEHALAMFKLRGGGDEVAAATGTLEKVPAARLVILPATSHIGISGESAVLVPMVRAFLDDATPATPDLF
jgi:pimeloyl-ACP methyl ester carboxylesterase